MWLIQIEITTNGALGTAAASQRIASHEYIWCDWPVPQQYLSYADRVGGGRQKRGTFTSFNGKTHFDEMPADELDHPKPCMVEAPGSEGRGTCIQHGFRRVVLQLIGLEHTHPKKPRMGQTGTGRIFMGNIPSTDSEIRWKVMENYPAAG